MKRIPPLVNAFQMRHADFSAGSAAAAAFWPCVEQCCFGALCKMGASQIQYSEKYFDDDYEYRCHPHLACTQPGFLPT